MTRNIDVPDYVYPIIPSPTDYKLARRKLAAEIMGLGFIPGRYELSDAKARIDPSSARMRLHIENRLAAFDRHQLLQAFIEQHDALLVTERTRIQRARLSLAHEVEYDRLDAIEHARKEFGDKARHYRYLLEKTVNLSSNGVDRVTEDVLRELVGLVDWFMVLTGASDTLHNGIDVGGVEIDDSYIPEVFYSTDFGDREATFAKEYAKSRLGLGTNDKDAVEGESEGLLASEKLKKLLSPIWGSSFRICSLFSLCYRKLNDMDSGTNFPCLMLQHLIALREGWLIALIGLTILRPKRLLLF